MPKVSQPERRRIQPRVKGETRDPLPSCVDPRVRNAVERDAIRWNCSRSWIVAFALAAFYDIDIVTPMPTKRRRGGKRG